MEITEEGRLLKEELFGEHGKYMKIPRTCQNRAKSSQGTKTKSGGTNNDLTNATYETAKIGYNMDILWPGLLDNFASLVNCKMVIWSADLLTTSLHSSSEGQPLKLISVVGPIVVMFVVFIG